MFTLQRTLFIVKLRALEAALPHPPQPAASAGQHPLWFSPPNDEEIHCRFHAAPALSVLPLPPRAICTASRPASISLTALRPTERLSGRH